jgi:hypothetical protein
MSARQPPKLDAARAGAERRKGLPAVEAAYRRVFDNPDGHVVLIDLIVTSGLTQASGPAMTDAHLRHNAGASALALTILKRAGFDGQAVAAAMLSENLRGLEHHAHHDTPEPILPGSPGGPEF